MMSASYYMRMHARLLPICCFTYVYYFPAFLVFVVPCPEPNKLHGAWHEHHRHRRRQRQRMDG